MVRVQEELGEDIDNYLRIREMDIECDVSGCLLKHSKEIDE